MIKDVLERINGIEIFGILSLVLFVTAFLIAVIRALRMRRSDVQRFKQLPLEDGPPSCRQGDT